MPKPRTRKTRKTRKTIQPLTPPATVPGTLEVDPAAPASSLVVMAYGPDAFEERQPEDLKLVKKVLESYPVTWVHVQGLGTEETLKGVGEMFNLHPLVLEDVVNVNQRSKMEQYGDQLYMVARMPVLGERVSTEQISIVLGEGFVLGFQERTEDWFEPIRDRIRNARGRIRGAGPDYLAYALLDAVTDHYFPLLEEFGERLQSLEETVITTPAASTTAAIHQVKIDLLTLRRAIWPMRDALNSILRNEAPMVKKRTLTYFRDCYDHVVQILDHLEGFREVGSGLMDVYLTSASNRMNEVMKILTMIATIFIPLSFIAGLYGMNFNTQKSTLNMPELNWAFGYPFALLLMAIVAGGLVLLFRKKGWLGSGPKS
jgi:magnesium transporter